MSVGLRRRLCPFCDVPLGDGYEDRCEACGEDFGILLSWDDFLRGRDPRDRDSVPDDELARFFRRRAVLWTLEPARIHYDLRSNRFFPSHLTALTVLVCCVDHLSQLLSGRPEDLPANYCQFLGRFGSAPEVGELGWMSVVPSGATDGDVVAHRFVSSFRNALVHALRIRQGDALESGRGRPLFYWEPRADGGGRLLVDTIRLMDELHGACRRFLEELVGLPDALAFLRRELAEEEAGPVRAVVVVSPEDAREITRVHGRSAKTVVEKKLKRHFKETLLPGLLRGPDA